MTEPNSSIDSNQDPDTILNEPQQEKNSTMKTFLFVLAIIILTVFIAVLALSVLNDEEETSDSTNNSSQTNSTEQQPVVSSDNNSVSELIAAEDAINDNITVTEDEDYYYFASNGLPTHETGTFPNANNPNTISAQDYSFKIAKNPEKLASLTASRIFGITLGGVPFDPGTAETDADTGWSIEAFQELLNLGLDMNNAHVQPSGAYHYHGIPEALVANDSINSHSTLIGFAGDGFPVYARYGYSNPDDASSTIKVMTSSWQLKTGQRVDGPAGEYDGTYTNDFEFVENSGDLDECGGRYTVTPEYPEGTYAYFFTDEFPYIPRCVYGTLDNTFSPAQGAGAPNQQGGGQQPPPMR